MRSACFQIGLSATIQIAPPLKKLAVNPFRAGGAYGDTLATENNFILTWTLNTLDFSLVVLVDFVYLFFLGARAA